MTSAESFQSLYSLLSLLGMDPHRVEVNYSDPDTGGRIVLAIPSTKIGISLEGDSPAPFIEDGWHVTPLTLSALQQLNSVMRLLSTMSFEDQRRRSMDTTKQTSRPEETLLVAIIQRGLPLPNRNHRIDRDDGRELTTPDFVWEDVRVAFFVDGMWWHAAREDHAILKGLQNSDHAEAVLHTNSSRVQKDLRIRSEMQARGWVVLACTDQEIQDSLRVEEIVTLIRDTIQRVRAERSASRSLVSETSAGEQISIEDLLS